MHLNHWAKENGLSLAEIARRIGLEGANPVATLRRYVIGERVADSAVVEAVRNLTGGAVTVADFHQARLDYLRDHAPERLRDVEPFSANPVAGVVDQ